MTVAEKVRDINAQRGRENRANGMKFEWKVASMLSMKKNVGFVLNAKGSRGVIDVLVQMKNKKQLWCVVKKNGYIPPKERKEIEDVKKYAGDNVEVRVYRKWGSKIIWNKA